MKKILVLAAMVAAMMAGQSNADFILSNTITGTNPNTSNPYVTGQVTNANVTASGIGRGGGIIGEDADDRYNARSWNTNDIDLTAYFTFTITPNSGFQIDFTSFTYTGQASATGPTLFSLRSGQDGFLASIGTPTAGGATIDLSTLSNALTATEFRLYAWNAGNANGTFSINSFDFQGTISAVPEPSSLMLVGSIVGAVMMRRRRRA